MMQTFIGKRLLLKGSLVFAFISFSVSAGVAAAGKSPKASEKKAFISQSKNTSQKITKAALQEKYRNDKKMTVIMQQTKTASYLIEPMVSKVKLQRLNPHEFSWELLEPYPSLFTFKDGVLVSDSRAQKSQSGTDPQRQSLQQLTEADTKSKVQAKIKSIAEMISALIAVDFKTIEEKFVVTLTDNQVIAEPNAKTKAFFDYRITMLFGDRLELKKITLDRKDESIVLSVLSLLYE